MDELGAAIDAIADEERFSGVVRVDEGDHVRVAKAYGFAHRGYEIPNSADTQFAVASGTKGLTALAVVSLIEAGSLALTTTARSVLGKDLPLIRDDVTIEHLLAHRSGIGDYFDEDNVGDITDYAMPVPVHELATTEHYVRVLDGHPTNFAPDEQFRLSERLHRLNELGFDVDEIELQRTEEGYRLQLHSQVVEPGHHRGLLRRLTGLVAQENQARRLLNDITAYRAQLERKGRRPVSEAALAGRWLTEVFEPTIAAIPQELWGKREAAELYHELLEHRWYLSERAGRDVGL